MKPIEPTDAIPDKLRKLASLAWRVRQMCEEGAGYRAIGRAMDAENALREEIRREDPAALQAWEDERERLVLSI